MAIRTVRLDEEAEEVLDSLRKATRMSTSQLLKRGLRSLQENLLPASQKTAFEIYCEMDLGPGGASIGPSADVSRTVKAAISKKLRK
jgi:hypothetical protein